MLQSLRVNIAMTVIASLHFRFSRRFDFFINFSPFKRDTENNENNHQSSQKSALNVSVILGNNDTVNFCHKIRVGRGYCYKM